jgi:hypothetical protein
MIKSLFIRSLTSVKKNRSFSYNSCSCVRVYQPIFTPFMACLTTGCFFTYINLLRSRKQYEKLYLEIQDLKNKIK